MNKLFSLLFVLCFGAIGFLGYKIHDTQFGVVIPKIIAFYEDSLQGKVTSSATSMTLVRGTDKRGNSISGRIGFVIEEGTSTEEVVICNVTGTALTNCARGIDPITGETEVVALQFAHPRGSSIKITNFPSQAILSRIASGSESFQNILYYVGNRDFSTASSSTIVDKNYVDNVSILGGSNATTALQGFVELATQAELVAGTQLGGTGATLVIPGNFFTGSKSAQKAVVTGVNGWITQGVLNSIQASTALNKVPLFTLTASAQGDIWYQSSTGTFVNLPASGSGSFLMTQGAGANPIWVKSSVSSNELTETTSLYPVASTVTGSTIALGVKKNNARVFINLIGNCYDGTDGSFYTVYPQVDGASVSNQAYIQNKVPTGMSDALHNCSFSVITNPLSTGYHIFRLRVQSNTAAKTAAVSTGIFQVYEIQ